MELGTNLVQCALKSTLASFFFVNRRSRNVANSESTSKSLGLAQEIL